MALPGDSRFPPGAPARLPTPRCNRNDASTDDDAAACRDPATNKERRSKTAAFSKTYVYLIGESVTRISYRATLSESDRDYE